MSYFESSSVFFSFVAVSAGLVSSGWVGSSTDFSAAGGDVSAGLVFSGWVGS